MEKQPYEEYRDNLAEKLKEIRNSDEENPELAKATAKGYLNAKKEGAEYETASKRQSRERQLTSDEEALISKFQSVFVKFKLEKPVIIEPTNQNYDSLSKENNIDNAGKFTLNPETIDINYKKVKIGEDEERYMHDDNLVGQGVGTFVQEHTAAEIGELLKKQYNTEQIPGIELIKFLKKNPKLIPDFIKNKRDQEFYLFGSLICDDGGKWKVVGIKWDDEGKTLRTIAIELSATREYSAIILE